MKRHLKLIAVVAVVVLALSGFSQARGGKGGGGSKGGGRSSSGGGGCGKDKSSRSSYNSGYRYTTSGGSSSGSSGSSSSSAPPERKPNARIITCADRKKGTVVELTGTNQSDTYTVRVSFLDENGLSIDIGTERVHLKAYETKRVEVKQNNPRTAPPVEDCFVNQVQ